MKSKRFFAVIIATALLLGLFLPGLGIIASAAPSYTLTFDANGGSDAPPPQATTAYTLFPISTVLTSVIPTREDHIFKGWATNPSATTVQYQPGESYTFSANMTLYAVWEPTCTITYDANSGSGAPAEQIAGCLSQTVLSQVVPTLEGYTFRGWAATDSATAAQYQPGGSYSFTADTTLYAVWEFGIEYTVTYAANGGSGAPAPQKAMQGTPLPLSKQTPTRSSYKFLCWCTSSTGNLSPGNPAPRYNPGDTIVLTEPLTLYALWTTGVLVRYDANGGSGAPMPHPKNSSSSIRISDVAPTREGYTFIGWSKTASSNTAQYLPGKYYTDIAIVDITLYAVWERGYTVTYDANGGDGAPAAQTKYSSAVLTLTTIVPTRAGFGCRGWSTTATATTAQFPPGGNFNINADTTLYAVWAPAYAITYDANGGTGAPTAQSQFFSAASLTLSPDVPYRLGYAFLGWADTAPATAPQYLSGKAYPFNADTTLYAVWGPAFAVTYDANGGSGTPMAQTKYINTALPLSTSLPYRLGYNFLGWADTASATTPQFSPYSTYSANADITLYAVWAPSPFAIPDLRPDNRIPIGIYPQSRVTDPGLIAQLNTAEPDSYSAKLGDVELDGTRYARIKGDWFRFDPVVWRVLGTDPTDDTVLLMTDRVINAHASGTFTANIFGQLVEDNGVFDFINWLEDEVNLRCFSPGVYYQDYLQLIPVDVPLNFLGVTWNLGAFFKAWVYGSTLTTLDINASRWGFESTQNRIASPTEFAVAAGTYTNGTSARWWAFEAKLLSTNLVTGTFGLGTCVDYSGSVRDPVAGYHDSRMGLRPIVKLKRALFFPAPVALHSDISGVGSWEGTLPVVYGQPLVLPEAPPAPERYRLLGWSEDPNAETPDYLPGHTWFANPERLRGYEYTIDRPTDLYAVWELITYPIAYDANGGTGAPEAQTKIHDEPLTLSTEDPTPEGSYIFRGWADTPSADIAQYQPGDPYTDNAGTTLYAVWAAEYQLRFFDGVNPAMLYKAWEDEDFQLPVPNARAGLEFRGWAEAPLATQPKHLPDDAVRFDSDTDLYAVWVFGKTPGSESVIVSPADAFDDGTQMSVSITGYDTYVGSVSPDQPQTVITYSITFSGYPPKPYPLATPVTVRLTIPQWFFTNGGNVDQLVVMHMNDPDPVKDVTYGQEDGRDYLEFQTYYFSEYSIVYMPLPSLRFFYGGGADPKIWPCWKNTAFYFNRVTVFTPPVPRPGCVLLGWADAPGAAVAQYGINEIIYPTGPADFYAVWMFSKPVPSGENVAVLPADAFEPGTQMNVSTFGYNSTVGTVSPGQPQLLITYDITFTGDPQYPLAIPVTVRLTIPQSFFDNGGNVSQLAVMHMNDLITDVTYGQEDGRNYLEFQTDHFSEYSIVYMPKADGGTPGGEVPGSETPGGEIPGGEVPSNEAPGATTAEPVAKLPWWQTLPPWLWWLLRICAFGWIWMS